MNKAEENALREGLYTKRRMTNIVLAWCFLLDISVSVIRLKGIQGHDCFMGTQRIYSVKHIFEMQIVPKNFFS